MTTLRYRPHARIEELAINECTIHRAASSESARWRLLWFYVLRDTDAQPEAFCVPVNPNGGYVEDGPGGRTWGLSKSNGITLGESNWTISPSINVLDSRDAVAGSHVFPSIWHQTPEILDVPNEEMWATGAPP